jgi:hypothetical protein
MAVSLGLRTRSEIRDQKSVILAALPQHIAERLCLSGKMSLRVSEAMPQNLRRSLKGIDGASPVSQRLTAVGGARGATGGLRIRKKIRDQRSVSHASEFEAQLWRDLRTATNFFLLPFYFFLWITPGQNLVAVRPVHLPQLLRRHRACAADQD